VTFFISDFFISDFFHPDFFSPVIFFISEAFRVFDREGHGFITVPDLIQVLTSLGDKLTQGG
jgi:hypothetical protein